MLFDISDDALFKYLSLLQAISAHKERSTPVAVLTIQRPDREYLNDLAKSSCVHGGALVDFGSNLTQRSFAPQSGQIYCWPSVGVTSGLGLSPSRYLATANRFLLLGDRNP